MGQGGTLACVGVGMMLGAHLSPRARGHIDSAEVVFTLVSDATLYERPIADRHRLIFYLGHLDAFDWNQVARDALRQSVLSPLVGWTRKSAIIRALRPCVAVTSRNGAEEPRRASAR